MERKEEIKPILKELLYKVEKAIDKNYYSDNYHEIIKSSDEVVDLAKELELYINELKK